MLRDLIYFEFDDVADLYFPNMVTVSLIPQALLKEALVIPITRTIVFTRFLASNCFFDYSDQHNMVEGKLPITLQKWSENFSFRPPRNQQLSKSVIILG